MPRAAVEQLGVTLLAVVLAAVSAVASIHLPVSTNVPQAQVEIDRGLFFYYAYDGDDAARAFAQASSLDPRLAMAYWGIALADGPDLNAPLTEDRFALAARAIDKARSNEAGASLLERRFIEAMALRYKGSFASWAADDAAYRGDMLALAESSRDQNAELLAAEALLEHGGLTWRDGVLSSDESREALELVSSVLRDDPSSLMANHLCIHLYDLAADRAPALPCAQRLDAADLPPQAEHLAHMPAHYWIETGNYTAALHSSERAYALLTQLTASDGESEHTERYGKHDVAVGYSAAMMLGNYAGAQQWSQRMGVVFGTSFDALTALRFGRYEAAYAADGSEFAAISVRGLAALQMGRVPEARALAKGIPSGNAAQGYLPQLFLARLAEAEGDYDEAERLLARARANQQATFAGELIPLIPADEAVGAFCLRRGDSAGAIAAFTDTLAAYPDDPRALFGLSQALTASGTTAQATAARLRFQKEWEGADTNVQDALP
jgi:tetratricopeptide (TPR) repeat protein